MKKPPSHKAPEPSRGIYAQMVEPGSRGRAVGICGNRTTVGYASTNDPRKSAAIDATWFRLTGKHLDGFEEVAGQ